MSDLPEALKPYRFHGLDFDWNGNLEEQVQAECPFCAKEKFFINPKNGLWKCFTCDAGSEKGGGNSTEFMRSLWNLASDATSNYASLAKERMVEETTLIRWEVVKNPLNDRWMVPGYSIKKTLTNLYKYTMINGKRRLLSSPTKDHSHCLFGMNLYKHDENIIYLCEGPWDAMALWELKPGGTVLGTPGANTFKETWASLFSGKIVNILFDNDHPKTNRKTGKVIEGAGIAGVKRTTAILTSSPKPPLEINYIKWGEEGFDSDLPSGTDVRDFINT